MTNGGFLIYVYKWRIFPAGHGAEYRSLVGIEKGFHGISWGYDDFIMGFHGIMMIYHGISWDYDDFIMGFHGIMMIYHGILYLNISELMPLGNWWSLLGRIVLVALHTLVQ
jgi:hypothetical protein